MEVIMAATARNLRSQLRVKKKRLENRKKLKKKKNWPLVHKLLRNYSLEN